MARRSAPAYMQGLTGIMAAVSTSALVPIGTEDVHVPASYRVKVDDDACPYLLEMEVDSTDGTPRCVDLRCQPRPGGAAVTSEGLRRLTLARYVRESVWLYAQVLTEQDGRLVGYPADSREATRVERAMPRARRREITDNLLREVADVYRGAKQAPTTAVMRHFKISRPSAGRWVMEARRRRHLEPASDNATKGNKRGGRR